MVARKLVVHAKYADQTNLKQTYQSEGEDENNTSRSKSREQSKKKHGAAVGKRTKESKVINLQRLQDNLSASITHQDSISGNYVDIDADANYESKDNNQENQQHPLRHFESIQVQQMNKNQQAYPATEMSK